MSDSMIERVAKAICRASCGPRMQRDEPDRVECQVANGWDMWTDEARAAIEAMREPTEAMAYPGGDRERGIAEDAWNYMIDAALK